MLDWLKRRASSGATSEGTSELRAKVTMLERRVAVLESRVSDMVSRAAGGVPRGASNDPWRVVDNDIETLD
jgi:hypothetical protein